MEVILILLVGVVVCQWATIYYLEKSIKHLQETIDVQRTHIDAQNTFIDVQSKAKWN